MITKDLIWNKAITLQDITKQTGIDINSINQTIKKLDINIHDYESIKILGKKLNFNILVNDRKDILKSINQFKKTHNRLPIISIMGHVDHGKTSLLQSLMGNQNVEIKEAGGITQNISVQKITISQNEIILLDTPGHVAFNTLRKQVLKVCDLVIVVISAVDGIQQQTKDVLKNAKNIIVAINKIDLAQDYEKIFRQLSQENIIVEQYGGEVPCVMLSAKQGKGIDLLMENINIYCDLLDIKADKEGNAVGYVVDSFIKKGIGVITRIILHSGSIKVGDNYIIGNKTSIIKKILVNDTIVNQASFNEIIDIVTIDPAIVGEQFFTVDKNTLKNFLASDDFSEKKPSNESEHSDKRSIILKALNANSLISLQNMFNDHNIIHSNIGEINENDLQIQKKNDAVFILLGNFNKSKKILDKLKVPYFADPVIYKLIEQFTEYIRPKNQFEYKEIGKGLILITFNINNKDILGFKVLEGEMKKGYMCKIYKKENDQSIEIATGNIISMEREKESIDLVGKGSEAGIVLNYKEKTENPCKDCYIVCLEQVKVE